LSFEEILVAFLASNNRAKELVDNTHHMHELGI